MKHRTPSETALRIAANKVAASLDPVRRKYLADPEEPYSEWFIRAHSPGARLRLLLCKWAPTRNLLFQLSDARYPGGSLHLLLRKRYIAETVRTALAESQNPAEQVVIFGAGFDPLALLLQADFPAVPFIEIDHPDTQAVKTRALQRKRALPENVTFLPVDFATESVEEKLQALPAFRPNARSLFLAEGLLMYLGEEDVRALFDLVRRSSAAGSRFGFTFLDRAALADPASPVAQMARDLERLGEPFQWSLDRKKLDPFLRHHGFKREALADHQTLRTRYPQSADLDYPPVRGEVIVVAQAL